MRLAAHLSRWLVAAGLGTVEPTAAMVEAFLEVPPGGSDISNPGSRTDE
jgi:hypothetical protein